MGGRSRDQTATDLHQARSGRDAFQSDPRIIDGDGEFISGGEPRALPDRRWNHHAACLSMEVFMASVYHSQCHTRVSSGPRQEFADDDRDIAVLDVRGVVQRAHVGGRHAA
jgi:hypothetical protein